MSIGNGDGDGEEEEEEDEEEEEEGESGMAGAAAAAAGMADAAARGAGPSGGDEATMERWERTVEFVSSPTTDVLVAEFHYVRVGGRGSDAAADDASDNDSE